MEEQECPRPDWSEWGNREKATVEEAVLLSLDIEPSRAAQRLLQPLGLRSEYEKRLRIAEDGFCRKPLVAWIDRHTDEQIVVLKPFRAWGEALPNPFTFPKQFPEEGAAAPTKWPWGEEETEYLRVLAEAVRVHWDNYSPERIERPPKNEIVANWLQEQTIGKGKVSASIAGAIATIIRHGKSPHKVRTEQNS